MRVMMILGMFVFSINTTAFDNLKRSTAWRHASTTRIGARAAHQFLGVDEETITIAGITYMEIATTGRVSLEALEAMANTGKRYTLIGGDFKIYGDYVIESLETTRTEFFPDGAARKIEFSLQLKRVDDKSGFVMGLLSAVANKVIQQ
jgi:phage protein U